jgi:hypothetical protein
MVLRLSYVYMLGLHRNTILFCDWNYSLIVISSYILCDDLDSFVLDTCLLIPKGAATHIILLFLVDIHEYLKFGYKCVHGRKTQPTYASPYLILFLLVLGLGLDLVFSCI